MAFHRKTRLNRTSISSDIVEYLQTERAMTLQEIGDELNLSKSFISKVRRGKRNFTLNDLMELEIAQGEPLPLLLIEAININPLPSKLRTQYKILATTIKVVLADQEKLKNIIQGVSPLVQK